MGNGAQIDPGADADFPAIQNTERFHTLKKRHRSFVLPVTGLCLLWYLAYVLLAGYAPQFMAIPVFGSVNVGILLGLAQIVTTFAVTMIYVSYANRRIDPIATELREEIEAGEAVR
jgi:uncharacterized membrane protein (DUF485 family)